MQLWVQAAPNVHWNKEIVMQNKLNVWFIVVLTRPGPVTTTFCVRFHSPSSMLKSYCSFNPLWTMNATIFQETSNLYHIIEPIFGRLFPKIILGCSLRCRFIEPYSFYLQRNAETRFWSLFFFVFFFFFFSFIFFFFFTFCCCF